MAIDRRRKKIAYGLSNPLQDIGPLPVVADRDPTTADFDQVGAIWANKSSDNFFVLTSISGGSANWQAPATSSSTVSSLTVTGGEGTVLDVQASGDTSLGGDLSVSGNTTMTGNLTVNGDTTINGDFGISSADALAFTTTSNTDPALSFTTNGGTSEKLQLTASQGTAADSIAVTSTAGGITLTSNLATDDGINLTATGGGVDIDSALQMNLESTQNAANAIVINASNSGGIDITADGGAGSDLDLTCISGSITMTSGENVATAMAFNANNGGGIDITADGAAGQDLDLACTSGSVNISAGEAATDAITLDASSGGVTATSASDAADSIYLHANAGTSEKIRVHADQGTGSDSVELESDAGGITFTSPAANGVTVNNGTQSAQILVGSGDPSGSVTAASGSIYMRTDTTAAATKLYVNHSSGSGTTWTALS